jgi:hypothetical protein
MGRLVRYWTPGVKSFLAGSVTALAVLWLIHSAVENGQNLTLYPVHIEKSAKSLLGEVSCTSYDGDFVVSGDVVAPANSGVLKIGANVNLGSGTTDGPLSGWYTYFDTNDPAFGTQGGGVLVFTVDVGNALVNGEATALNGRVNYCSVFVSKVFS